MIQHKYIPPAITGAPVLPQDILNQYNQYSSNAGIYVPNPVQAKLQTTPQAIGTNDYRIVALPQATAGGTTRGTGFVIDPTSKYIVATRNMFAVEVVLFCSASWGEADGLCLGVGIGDPANMPQYAGLDQAGKCYVSRFYDQMAGKSGRINTLKVTQSPIGRNALSGNGITQGDKIFPVMWNLETSQHSVSIYDLIMSVTELPASV